jgi:Zn-dependent protease
MLENLLNYLNVGTAQELIIRLFVVFFSLSLHEFAHGWRAYRLGDDTAKNAGRLTMNPLVHLDPMGTLMMIFARVGWAKPVPINPVRFTRAKSMKRGIVEVSFAGPASNLLLSFVSYFVFRFVVLLYTIFSVNPQADNIFMNTFIMVFSLLVSLNIYLAMFNLLPIPPLDGYKIFGSLLPDRIYYKLMDYERYIGLIFIALFIFSRNIFAMIIDFLAAPFFFIIMKPIDLLFVFIQSVIVR